MNHNADYEIDKQEGKFVSSKYLIDKGNDPDSGELRLPDDNTLSSMTDDTGQGRPKFSDGSKLEYEVRVRGKLVTRERCEVQEALLPCLNGDVDGIEAYLNKIRGTDDYEIFLHGEDRDGNTALCLAAMEIIPEMVALLLDYGSDVNARNHARRTPLMEAALWGRRETVRILLEHSADKTLQDQAGKRAIDLAQTLEENEKERERRAEENTERPYQARQDRNDIVRMLTDWSTQDDAPNGQRSRYVPQIGSIELVTPIAQPANTDENADGWNHIAVLDRGEQFPPVNASSRVIDGAKVIVVGGQSLWQLVVKIASLVGHQLTLEPNQDRDEPSRFSASHAEKQLIAYFVDKHLFLPDDVIDNELFDQLLRDDQFDYGVSDNEGDAGEAQKIALTELKRVQPPVCLKRATIVTSAAACPECEDFCRRVNLQFGIELSLKTPKEDGFIPRNEVQFGDEIGSGSFGKVYHGTWKEAQVVVKCVEITGQAEDEKRIKRANFLNEVRLWRQIRHPNIVQFFGACYDDASCLIISEYALGGTLPKFLNNHREAGKPLVWKKLHEVALGLKFLHEQKIVHSDLKGDNILVGKDGTAMLADFGLSFELSESRPNMKKWGAIQWRPPEYVVENGAGPSVEADVYALGMCIVEAVTGRRTPWGNIADSQVKTFLRNKEMMPKPSEMSEEEWSLVETMCKFEPSARLSLAQVILQLKDLAEQEAPNQEKYAESSGHALSPISRQPRYVAGSLTGSGLF